MNKKTVPSFHGSDIEKVEKTYHIDKNEIDVFSSNVNPLGISSKINNELNKIPEYIKNYPDRNYTDIRNEISKYVCTQTENILVGNGATELISSFIKINNTKKAMLFTPTYSEYERELILNGGECHYFVLKEEENFEVNLKSFEDEIDESFDLLIICNPNNPTSTAIYNDDMSKILDICKKNNVFVMIDETYVEFCDDLDDISAVKLIDKYENFLILRGLSKFFSSPGLRLGYGITSNKNLIEKMKSSMNPWSVNSIADKIGKTMISDNEFILESRLYMKKERFRVVEELKKIDYLKVFEPKANFVLIKILRNDITAKDMFEYLIQNKIMVRVCDDFPTLNDKFFRFCFMTKDLDNRLIKLLKEI